MNSYININLPLNGFLHDSHLSRRASAPVRDQPSSDPADGFRCPMTNVPVRPLERRHLRDIPSHHTPVRSTTVATRSSHSPTVETVVADTGTEVRLTSRFPRCDPFYHKFRGQFVSIAEIRVSVTRSKTGVGHLKRGKTAEQPDFGRFSSKKVQPRSETERTGRNRGWTFSPSLTRRRGGGLDMNKGCSTERIIARLSTVIARIRANQGVTRTNEPISSTPRTYHAIRPEKCPDLLSPAVSKHQSADRNPGSFAEIDAVGSGSSSTRSEAFRCVGWRPSRSWTVAQLPTACCTAG